MWPDWASWQLEISPVTQMSVKLRAKRSRILEVSFADGEGAALGQEVELKLAHDPTPSPGVYRKCGF